ncbi:MAG: DUF2089 domain-containing protein [Anaerolineales bacterium]|nr:DUF2089 domain-containing protein [Anaerolineales bacterium]MCB0008479.1 DUF2089 domain-containing protein [Anaerolineales bacterium]MCB0014882.1 DUF2089 domain-containing protein [Anaerolineales bacterium]MCB0026877.1 DUF2089 domain-containing protein [Anaerolineales bacterium]MCB8959496.1 DUF2089 domain-containing protein [Ardenticatenales bacterium]
MNAVIGQCPICGDQLAVTRLHCRQCDTTLSGHFSLGRLFQLSPEQLGFVETFVRCEGKLNKVGELLDLSYPTVRSRLTEVITALGYEVGPPEPAGVPEEMRQSILAKVANGDISADEAIKMLRG